MQEVGGRLFNDHVLEEDEWVFDVWKDERSRFKFMVWEKGSSLVTYNVIEMVPKDTF